MVINEQRHDLYFKPSEEALTNAQIELRFQYFERPIQPGWNPDVAMIEAMVQLDPVFTNYSYEGIPDLRVILFRGYPVMAMLRLATHVSDGKSQPAPRRCRCGH